MISVEVSVRDEVGSMVTSRSLVLSLKGIGPFVQAMNSWIDGIFVIAYLTWDSWSFMDLLGEYRERQSRGTPR